MALVVAVLSLAATSSAAAADATGADAAASPVPLHAYVVTVADPGTASVPLGTAVDWTREAIAYWAREARGAIDVADVAGAATLALNDSCSVGPERLWDEAEALFPDVDFGHGTGNHVVVASPAGCAYGWAGYGTEGTGFASSGAVQVVAGGARSVAHELGHNFGLMHSNLEVETGAPPTELDYEAPYSPMAGIYAGTLPSLDLAFQELLGVPGAAAAVLPVDPTTAGTRTVDLAPASFAGDGARGVRFPLGDGSTGYVEYRPGAGVDADASFTRWHTGDVTLGGVPVSAGGGVRVYRLDTTRQVTTLAPLACGVYEQALHAGDVWSDVAAGVSVQVVAIGPASARVVVRTQQVAPAPGPCATRTDVSVGTARYGAPVTVRLAVTSPAGAVSGWARVYRDGVLVGRVPVTAGSARYTFPAGALHAGSYAITAVLVGDERFRTSTATASVRVAKAVPRVRVVAHTALVAGRPATLRVRVYPGASAPAAGVVRVKLGSRYVSARVEVVEHAGWSSATVRTSRALGHGRLVVVYAGDADHRRAVSGARLVS
ncbi:Ig-like domain repeat protein [Cellulomonas alba]|uniref:Ig-like domain repeat protein n=1 Tax=Cellulomonas alba TaxID=3053467 RepID=A0ABT7SCI8_9CELL|nr:Ig-like domain repeat protein [Cellulomonas alba]MDM7853902.1 Ig-like domain repeat protein [Cellulomonas alba]